MSCCITIPSPWHSGMILTCQLPHGHEDERHMFRESRSSGPSRVVTWTGHHVKFTNRERKNRHGCQCEPIPETT